jgi:hypothetical protein
MNINPNQILWNQKHRKVEKKSLNNNQVSNIDNYQPIIMISSKYVSIQNQNHKIKTLKKMLLMQTNPILLINQVIQSVMCKEMDQN